MEAALLNAESSIDEVSEEALMEDYINGKTEAFQDLFSLLGPRVKRFFLRKFKNEAIADDMQQITFMKLHRARHSYKLGEPLRPWLFTIAARVRIDELRKNRHFEDGSDEQLNQADVKNAMLNAYERDPIEKADLAKKVRSALNTLPESQQNVVRLHRYDGLTFKEIANELDLSEAAVKLRAFRAYGHLRKQLSPIASSL